MSNLSDIVTVNIDLDSPIVDTTSFDNFLIFGPAPKIPGTVTPADVGVYSNISEVTDCGWVSTGENADPVGVAAMVGFGQSPRPTAVYIAIQKALSYLSDLDVQIMTEARQSEIIGGYNPESNSLPWLQATYKRMDLTGGKLHLTITKNEDIVYDKDLSTLTANNEAYFQAVLGEATYDGEDALGIENGEENGAYRFRLEATTAKGEPFFIEQTISFNGTDTTEVSSLSSEPVLEDPVETLSRAVSVTGWYVACPAGISESKYEDIAAWIETQTKLFAYTVMGTEDPVGSVYYRSFSWFGKEATAQNEMEVPEANRYMHVAAVAKCLSYESGSETWAFKTLASVYPSELTGNDIKTLTDAPINYYTTYASKNITQVGKVRAGEWIDIIRFRDWLQNDMQVRILNLLLMNPKIPYTNSGISLVENQMTASLKAGTDRGGIAPDEYDEDGNLIPGFKVTVPNSANLTASQKASRILTGCKFSARIAGAIHAVEINGSLTYSY